MQCAGSESKLQVGCCRGGLELALWRLHDTIHSYVGATPAAALSTRLLPPAGFHALRSVYYSNGAHVQASADLQAGAFCMSIRLPMVHFSLNFPAV